MARHTRDGGVVHVVIKPAKLASLAHVGNRLWSKTVAMQEMSGVDETRALPLECIELRRIHAMNAGSTER